jgi:hypothetical protein
MGLHTTLPHFVPPQYTVIGESVNGLCEIIGYATNTGAKAPRGYLGRLNIANFKKIVPSSAGKTEN